MRVDMMTGGRLLLSALLLAGVASAAQAQSLSPAQSLLNDAFVLNLGGFILTTDTKAHLNGSSSTNPDIDFNDTFGKSSNATRVRADALWRITPNHHLRFLYFDNTVDRSRSLAQDVKWGDFTFHAGSNVEARTKFNIAELAYEYAFLRDPAYEISGSLGVHYMKLSQQLSGTATITDANGNVSAPAFSSKNYSIPVPLPVIGVRAAWAFAPQWIFQGQGQFFKAKIEGYDGRVTDLRADVTWMFNQHFGAGLGYNWFSTTVDANKSSFNGQVRLGYSGVQLFLTGAF